MLKSTLEEFVYSFTVEPEEQSRITLELPEEIELHAYFIDRENVTTHGIRFDNKYQKHLNAQLMQMVLYKPKLLKKSMTLVVNGSKLVLPETITIKLLGERT